MKRAKPIRMAVLMLASGLVTLPASAQLSRGDRYAGLPWATRSPVLAQHGMAATEQPLASLDRHRHPEERRQRGGRRDCGQCRASA